MKTLKFALLSSMALACGGSPEAGEAEHTPSEVDLAPLEGEVPSDAMLTPPPVDVEALRAASITGEEAELLDAYFEESGRGTPTSINGRLLHWDDASSTVDDVLLLAELLAKPKQVEKAYVHQGVADALSSTSIKFFRPDVDRNTYIIIPNNVPAYVFTAVASAIAEFANLGTDCLFTGVFRVTRQSDYDVLSATSKAQSYEVQFNWVPNTSSAWSPSCETSAVACARYPAAQNITVTVGGVAQNQTRITVGDFMFFNPSSFPNTTAGVDKLKRMVRHEFGHMLGLQHMDGNSQALHVPGTQSCGNCFEESYPSIMMKAGSGTFTADDLKVIRTLYSDAPNRPNDECVYVSTQRTLAALP